MAVKENLAPLYYRTKSKTLSKLLQSIGLKEKKPIISTTVADLAQQNLKCGYYSKRGPSRNSKYNLRYWVLTDSQLYYFASASPSENALGKVELRQCKVNTNGCADNEFVVMMATPEKTREYFCKTDTGDTRNAWGTAISSVIAKLNGLPQPHGGLFSNTSPNDTIGPRNSTAETTSNQVFTSSPSTSNSNMSSSSAGFSAPGSPSARPFSASTDTSAAVASLFHSGPVVPFNPQGAQEVVKVFLPDNSCKTVMFDTSQAVSSLIQQLLKKCGSGFDLYCIFTMSNNELGPMLPMEARLIDHVASWPSKNDPMVNRLVFQPKEEAQRLAASTVGVLNTFTRANTHSNAGRSSAAREFVTTVMTAIKSKPEWVGNLPMSALKTPYLHKGILTKIGSTAKRSTELQCIVADGGLYYFDIGAGFEEKSRGWVPLEKSGLMKDSSPLGFIVYYIYPGTLDLMRRFEAQCKTEEEKNEWMTVLSPLCNGAVPSRASVSKTVIKTGKSNSQGSSATQKMGTGNNGPKADVGAMLAATPSEGPKLQHPTAARPKAAGKRPPSRPGMAAAANSSSGTPSSGPSYPAASSSTLASSSPTSNGLFSSPSNDSNGASSPSNNNFSNSNANPTLGGGHGAFLHESYSTSYANDEDRRTTMDYSISAMPSSGNSSNNSSNISTSGQSPSSPRPIGSSSNNSSNNLHRPYQPGTSPNSDSHSPNSGGNFLGISPNSSTSSNSNNSINNNLAILDIGSDVLDISSLSSMSPQNNYQNQSRIGAVPPVKVSSSPKTSSGPVQASTPRNASGPGAAVSSIPYSTNTSGSTSSPVFQRPTIPSTSRSNPIIIPTTSTPPPLFSMPNTAISSIAPPKTTSTFKFPTALPKLSSSNPSIVAPNSQNASVGLHSSNSNPSIIQGGVSNNSAKGTSNPSVSNIPVSTSGNRNVPIITSSPSGSASPISIPAGNVKSNTPKYPVSITNGMGNPRPNNPMTGHQGSPPTIPSVDNEVLDIRMLLGESSSSSPAAVSAPISISQPPKPQPSFVTASNDMDIFATINPESSGQLSKSPDVMMRILNNNPTSFSPFEDLPFD